MRSPSHRSYSSHIMSHRIVSCHTRSNIIMVIVMSVMTVMIVMIMMSIMLSMIIISIMMIMLINAHADSLIIIFFMIISSWYDLHRDE